MSVAPVPGTDLDRAPIPIAYALRVRMVSVRAYLEQPAPHPDVDPEVGCTTSSEAPW